MAEETTERSHPLENDAEKKALGAPDVQKARTASAADVDEVQSTNSKKFESMTKLLTIKDGMSLDKAQAEFQSFGIEMGDNTTVTAKGTEAIAKRKVSVDPRPSYVEGLKAIGNDEEAQGKYSIEYMERKAKEARAGLQEKQGEQVLIASNVTPATPKGEQMRKFEAIQSDNREMEPDALTAWDAKDAYSGVRRDALGRDILRVMGSGVGDRAIFPYRGQEERLLSLCAKENPRAWNDAVEAFPGLGRYLTERDATLLMKALVRNELHNYDVRDSLGDAAAKYGLASSGETLGFAQITPLGVSRFWSAYPQLEKFLSDKGYGETNAADALRDPKCTPMIVAAKLQSEIDELTSTKDKLHPDRPVTINWRTLAYTYNPDVYFDPKAPKNADFHASIVPGAKDLEKLRGYEKAYPTSDQRVLKQSQHLKNVEEQMSLLLH